MNRGDRPACRGQSPLISAGGTRDHITGSRQTDYIGVVGEGADAPPRRRSAGCTARWLIGAKSLSSPRATGSTARDCLQSDPDRRCARGQVPRRSRARPGRHGDRRAGDAPPASSAGGDEVPAARGARKPAGRPALPARGAGGGPAEERARRARDRRRHARDRRALHGAGVPGGRRSLELPAIAADGRRDRRSDAASLRGARRGALARHRASRHQAGELLHHPARRRHAAAQGARLRDLEDVRRRAASSPRPRR